MLKDTILGDLKVAMKSKDELKTSVLRGLIASLNNRAIEKRTQATQGGQDSKDEPLTDEDVLSCLQKEAKKRRESIEAFQKGGRAELAEKEQTELKILEQYLPKQLSASETESEVVKIIQTLKTKDLKSAMPAVMASLKGRADTKLAAELVKKHLS